MSTEEYLAAAKATFAETIRLKLDHLYKYAGGNTEVIGNYVEELVRAMIRSWIGPSGLFHGTLFPHNIDATLSGGDATAKQIDGIVFNPSDGIPVIREDGFVVVHPAFCRGVIEVKTSVGNLRAFHDRLQSIWRQYFSPCFPPSDTSRVMGVVIHDENARKKLDEEWPYNYGKSGRCPIFILFSRDNTGRLVPHEEGIECMIRALFVGPIRTLPQRIFSFPIPRPST